MYFFSEVMSQTTLGFMQYLCSDDLFPGAGSWWPEPRPRTRPSWRAAAPYILIRTYIETVIQNVREVLSIHFSWYCLSKKSWPFYIFYTNTVSKVLSTNTVIFIFIINDNKCIFGEKKSYLWLLSNLSNALYRSNKRDCSLRVNLFPSYHLIQQ